MGRFEAALTEEVDVLLGGAAVRDDSSEEEVRNRMAIVGYGHAFEAMLRQAERDERAPAVTEALVRRLYGQLFRPSTEAGIVDPIDLLRYRDGNAFIRGTSYVPPGPEKVAALMEDYERSLRQVADDVIRAVLAHYFFVTIHPYPDGNGRTARLLMNYALLGSGFPLVTVRAEQRAPYFEALASGQVAGDIKPFGRFVVGFLETAAAAESAS